jgi:hypothetical protein
MPDKPPTDVFGGLPRTRPHRRSEKRAGVKPASAKKPTTTITAKPKPARTAAKAKPARKAAANPKTARAAAPKPTPIAAAKAKPRAAGARRPRPETLRQPAQPAGTPAVRRSGRPAPPSGVEIIGTAVQAAAELAEIGLSAGARALRNAVSRLPRP